MLKDERDIVFASTPLEATEMLIDGVRWTYVFYESGLSVNVLYTLEDAGKRAVGFKLSDGMEVPEELETKFKFVRQKSKLAGTIRGSYFVIKGTYWQAVVGARGIRAFLRQCGVAASGRRSALSATRSCVHFAGSVEADVAPRALRRASASASPRIGVVSGR